MVGGCILICPVISLIECSQPLENAKLFLTFSISEPMEPHIHSLGTFLLDIFVDHSLCRAIVYFYWHVLDRFPHLHGLLRLNE